ncbi:MAG TPA: hypothetical protein VGS18_02125, partial [Thermoplasmata archaeon]|nr:hypothetical protein [Thermoplasmata archaeon]
MRAGSTGMTILLAVAALVMLLPSVPAPTGYGLTTGMGSPVHPPAVGHPATSAPAILTNSPHRAGLAPTPKITCPAIPPTLWGYGVETPVSGLYPLSPALSYQTPCPIISQDEIHGSFFSSQSYSGERLKVPIYLPKDGTNTNQKQAYLEMYVGMIVGGNPSSEWRQSYAEVVFVPGSGSYAEYAAVWSMVNDSVYGGNSSEVGVWKCPSNSMYMSWNNSFY